MFETTRKALVLLSSEERRQIKWLFAATVGMALIEAAGIASVMPFMAFVARPELLETNRYLSSLHGLMGHPDPGFFQFALGLLALGVLVLANTFSAVTTWLLVRFAFLSGHSLSERLLSKYLSQPYVFFLNRNSAELTKNVLAEVHRYVAGVLLPSIRMFSKLIVAVTIVSLLLLVDSSLALVVASVLGGAYVIVYVLTRKTMTRIGKESVVLAASRYKIANEVFGGIKVLKLIGREGVLLGRYSESSRKFAIVEASSEVIAMLPRYALEALAFGGIILIVLWLLGTERGLGDILPLVSVYALAGYRLMPALQQIYSGMTKLRYHKAVIDILSQDLNEAPNLPYEERTSRGHAGMELNCMVELRDVCFSYPNTSSNVLEHLNIAVSANSTVGIVGTTGSGKTTLIDIFLGLLTPTHGGIFVDDVRVSSENLRDWQARIGYVPQVIYLADDTITRNVAFGVPDDQVDLQAVERATRIANLHDFIVSELPDQYETLVGERGVRLSGGQRQRIGIARALYHDPKLLVLDEATSALDGITESAIMDAISNLAHRKTIILVAHRLTTVKQCDVVYVLESGRIVDQGPYDRLLSMNPAFRRMANTL